MRSLAEKALDERDELKAKLEAAEKVILEAERYIDMTISRAKGKDGFHEALANYKECGNE